MVVKDYIKAYVLPHYGTNSALCYCSIGDISGARSIHKTQSKDKVVTMVLLWDWMFLYGPLVEGHWGKVL